VRGTFRDAARDLVAARAQGPSAGRRLVDVARETCAKSYDKNGAGLTLSRMSLSRRCFHVSIRTTTSGTVASTFKLVYDHTLSFASARDRTG